MSNMNNKDVVHIKEVLESTLYKLDPSTQSQRIAERVFTGFNKLDDLLTGLYPSNLIIVGACPGMGKSSFALNIACNAALKQNKSVCIFSLGSSRERLVQRLLSQITLINTIKIYHGENIDAHEWLKLQTAGEILSNSQIFIDDSYNLSVAAIKEKLKEMEHIDLVIIDDLQLISSARPRNSRIADKSYISRELKHMATELDVPVLLLSRLSCNTKARPQLSDLREGGTVEQDADVIIFLYRDSNEADFDKNSVECIVVKNRNAALGTIPLEWNGECVSFSDI